MEVSYRSPGQAQEGFTLTLRKIPMTTFCRMCDKRLSWAFREDLLRGNADEVGAGVLHQDETVALEDGLQNVERGHVFQANGERRKRLQLKLCAGGLCCRRNKSRPDSIAPVEKTGIGFPWRNGLRIGAIVPPSSLPSSPTE